MADIKLSQLSMLSLKGDRITLQILRTGPLTAIFGSISVSGQLPTYPSPNSTTVNVKVGLGEG